MIEPIQVLILDPDEQDTAAWAEAIRAHGWKVQTADTFGHSLPLFPDSRIDVAIINLMLPDVLGTEAWSHLHRLYPDAFGIITTSSVSLRTSVNAMGDRILAYVRKPFDTERLCEVIAEALEHQPLLLERSDPERRIDAFNDLLARLMSMPSADRVVAKTLVDLNEIVVFDWALVSLLDDNTQERKHEFSVNSQKNVPPLTDGQLHKVEELMELAVRSLRPVVISPSVTSETDAIWMRHSERPVRASVAVPLLGQSKTHGALAIVKNGGADNHIAPIDASLLMTVGHAMGIALDHVRFTQ